MHSLSLTGFHAFTVDLRAVVDTRNSKTQL